MPTASSAKQVESCATIRMFLRVLKHTSSMPNFHEPSPHRARGPLRGTNALVANRRCRRRKFPIAKSNKLSMGVLDFEIEHDAPLASDIIVQQRLTKSTAQKINKARNLSTLNSHHVHAQQPSPVHDAIPPQPSRNAPLPPVTLSHTRRALLVDTRTLDTNEGTAISASFLSTIQSFLESLQRRGMVPHLVTSLHKASDDSTRRKRPQMITKTFGTMCNASVHVGDFCEQFLIKPAINSSNQKCSPQAIKVPTRLLANASWNAFGDLVHDTTYHDQQSPTAMGKVPLSMTLLTHNVSLFCDEDLHGAHKAAICSFWSRIRPLFHTNSVRSIELVIVHTGSVTQRSEHMDMETPKRTDATAVESLAPKETEQHSKMFTGSHHMTNDIPMDNVTMKEAATPKNEIVDSNEQQGEFENKSTRVVQCVEQIRQFLTELAEADYKVDRARDTTVTPISISVMMLENTTSDFGNLARSWLSNLMSPPNLKGAITFDLPEAVDGTQCSIALEVKYRTLPYPADSPQAAGMLADLQQLSSCPMQVVQLVPVSCVDANLLFGVSMEVNPAFQNDEDQFQEMRALVYVLFQQLRDKDVALLLQVSSPYKEIKSSYGPPLHHTCHQTYLLMAHDMGSHSSRGATFEASLFRYAGAEQMLSMGPTELCAPSDSLLEPFAVYVERALDMLPNNLINPLVNDELRVLRDLERMAITTPIRTEMDAEAWTDTNGVGSNFKSEQETIVPIESVSPVTIYDNVWYETAESERSNDKIDDMEQDDVSKRLIEVGDAPVANESFEPIAKLAPIIDLSKAINVTNQRHHRRDAGKIPNQSHALPFTCMTTPSKKQKTKDVVSVISTKKDNEGVVASPHSSSELSEVAPTTVASLMQRPKHDSITTNPRATRRSNTSSQELLGGLSMGPGSQDSLDDISELAPETSRETNTLDQLTQKQKQALAQFLSSDDDDSDDDDWKARGYNQQIDARSNTPGSLQTKRRTDENSSSEEEMCVSMTKRKSFQRAASALLETLTDTDSDPEFAYT